MGRNSIDTDEYVNSDCYKIEYVDGSSKALLIKYMARKYNSADDMFVHCVIIIGEDGAYECDEPRMHHFVSRGSAIKYIAELMDSAETSFEKQ